MDDELHLWFAWAWSAGNDARNGLKIWAWLYNHHKPMLVTAFNSPLEQIR
jgi:hypothetical protein